MGSSAVRTASATAAFEAEGHASAIREVSGAFHPAECTSSFRPVHKDTHTQNTHARAHTQNTHCAALLHTHCAALLHTAHTLTYYHTHCHTCYVIHTPPLSRLLPVPLLEAFICVTRLCGRRAGGHTGAADPLRHILAGRGGAARAGGAAGQCPPHQARLAEQQHIQDSRNTSLHSSRGAGPLVSGPPPCVREVHTRVGR